MVNQTERQDRFAAGTSSGTQADLSMATPAALIAAAAMVSEGAAAAPKAQGFTAKTSRRDVGREDDDGESQAQPVSEAEPREISPEAAPGEPRPTARDEGVRAGDETPQDRPEGAEASAGVTHQTQIMLVETEEADAPTVDDAQVTAKTSAQVTTEAASVAEPTQAAVSLLGERISELRARIEEMDRNSAEEPGSFGGAQADFVIGAGGLAAVDGLQALRERADAQLSDMRSGLDAHIADVREGVDTQIAETRSSLDTLISEMRSSFEEGLQERREVEVDVALLVSADLGEQLDRVDLGRPEWLADLFDGERAAPVLPAGFNDDDEEDDGSLNLFDTLGFDDDEGFVPPDLGGDAFDLFG